MRRRKSNQWIAAAGMLVLSAVNIYGGNALYGVLKSAGQGTLVAYSEADAQTYHVDGVWQKQDGSYVVEAKADGFANPITVSVNFDAEGKTILGVEIVSQQESQGIGTQVTEDSFLSQFKEMAAPVQVKDMSVVSPGTGLAYGQAAGAESETEGEKVVVMDAAQWNSQDHSAEAEAFRNMYESGLLDSSIKGQSLATASADMGPEAQAQKRMYEAGLLDSSQKGQEFTAVSVDTDPEAQAQKRMYDAGLLGSAQAGQELAAAYADMPAEQKAEKKLAEASLTTAAGTEAAAAVSVESAGEASQVDAVSGATISSTAVASAIDDAFFFLNECVLAQ